MLCCVPLAQCLTHAINVCACNLIMATTCKKAGCEFYPFMVKFLVVVVSATGSETGWQAGVAGNGPRRKAGAGGESVCGKALPFSLVGIGKQRDIERESGDQGECERDREPTT